MIKLVIFDLDGTLLNTLADLAAAANAALVRCGFAPRRTEEVQQFVGNGVEKLLWRALPQVCRTPEQVARMKQAFFAYYDSHLWDHTLPYPSIGPVLQQLSARGVQLAVASNKYQHATQQLVQHFFPQIPFVAVLGQQEGFPTKPDPYMVHTVMARAHVPAQHVLYVGDSDVDMQTAARAAVQACGVLWGFRTREVLESYHPDYLISSPEELPGIVFVSK